MYINVKQSDIIYVPSLSTIVTVAYPVWLAIITSMGSRVGFTVTLKFSSFSKISSSIIDMFKVTSVSPA